MAYDTKTQTFTAPAAQVTCCECAIPFAVPAEWQQSRREDRATFWCPNGHQQAYVGPTEAQRLRDELTREKHRTEQAQSDAKWQRERREQAQRQLAARKGQITKMGRRIARGVCPCCNRHFGDLQRHMGTKHPEWQPEADAVLDVPATVVRYRNAWLRGATAAAEGAKESANPYVMRRRGAAYHRAWAAGYAAQRAATPTAEASNG